MTKMYINFTPVLRILLMLALTAAPQVSIGQESQSEEGQAFIGSESRGITIIPLFKALNTLYRGALSLFPDRRTYSRGSADSDVCIYELKDNNGRSYCKLSVDTESDNLDLFSFDQDLNVLKLSVEEEIIGPVYSYGRKLLNVRNHKRRVNAKQLVKFKNFCWQRYSKGQPHDYFKSFHYARGKNDDQLLIPDRKHHTYELPALVDDFGNQLCDVKLREINHKNKNIPYDQYRAVNKTEILIPENIDLKFLKLNYALLRSSIAQKDKKNNNNKKTKNKAAAQESHLASKACNEFVNQLMLKNPEIIFAYCPNDGSISFIHGVSFVTPKIHIVATDKLSHIIYDSAFDGELRLGDNFIKDNFDIDFSATN